MANNQAQPPSSAVVCSRLGDALNACAQGSTEGLESLARQSVPCLVAIAEQFLDHHDEIADVVHDTLELAWHNIWRFNAAKHGPQHWLMHIFGSRLNSQLSASHTQPEDDTSTLRIGIDRVNLPSPVLMCDALSAERLCAMAEQLPPAIISEHLKIRLTTALELLRSTRDMPLTPNGEPADPRLFDPILAPRMRLSRIANRTMGVLDGHIGKPLEQGLLSLWLHQAPGSTWVEKRGLPRHAIEERYSRQLDVRVDPRELLRQVNYPLSFPERKVRHRVGSRLLWEGDWDVPLSHALASRRTHFIADIRHHRRHPEHSRSYHYLAGRLARGNPIASHSDGIMLDRPERILAYLRRYLLYMESIICFGFDNTLGKDPLGVAVNRQGELIKINKGLHRLAMAQVLGIPNVTLKVRAIHRQWWHHIADGAQGQEALDKVLLALPHCQPLND